MKFKFKINEYTTLDDVQAELDALRSANVKEIPLNHLRRIIDFLGAIRVPATGSSVRFSHPILKKYPQYQGYFAVHKIHKGGDQEEIRKNDYKKYLYPALITIIEEKKLNK
jgi:hypothetical protein